MNKHRHAAQDLIELRTWLKPKGKQVQLIADLRAFSAEMEGDGFTASVAIKKATIEVELDGLDFAPGLRFGEPVAKAKTSTTVEKDQRKTEAEVKGKASIDTSLVPIVGGAAKGTMAVSQTSTTTTTTKEHHYPVRAIPGGRWLVTEPEDGPLSNSYLTGDALCDTVPITGSNRLGSTTRITAKQKDLVIKPVGKFFERFNVNQERLAAVVLAKALNGPREEGYRGVLVLCESEAEPEASTDER